MTTTQTSPITGNWINFRPAATNHDTTERRCTPHDVVLATAAEVNALLGQREVADITADLVPFMAAAAAELALAAGIAWQLSHDDTPVALLRLIAKVALSAPQSSGPHAGELVAQLS